MADPSLLETIRRHWHTQGWQPDTLNLFRMEGEGEGVPTVDSIMDREFAAEDSGGAPAEPVAAPEAAAPAAPAAPAGGEPQGDPEVFTRDYVEQLRRESARYRTERNQFADAFEGYEEADRGVLLDLARTLRTDPQAAAEWMREQAEAILAGQQQLEPQGNGEYLTPEQAQAMWQRMRNEERAAEEKARSVEQINNTVRELGYDPNGFDGMAFMAYAMQHHPGDLKAAHDAVSAMKTQERQKAIDEFVNGKKQSADGAVQPVHSGGAPVPAGQTPKTSAEMRAAAEAMLEATGY